MEEKTVILSGVDGTGLPCELNFTYNEALRCWVASCSRWNYTLALVHGTGSGPFGSPWAWSAVYGDGEFGQVNGAAPTMEDAARRAIREMGP